MSSKSIPQLSDDKLLDDANYASWRDTVYSLLRGKGLIGYALGTIARPVGPSPYTTAQATALNSTTPTGEEWELRNSIAGAIIYQNVKDPRAHNLDPPDESHKMWTTLSVKFQHTNETI